MTKLEPSGMGVIERKFRGKVQYFCKIIIYLLKLGVRVFRIITVRALQDVTSLLGTIYMWNFVYHFLDQLSPLEDCLIQQRTLDYNLWV